MAQGYLEKSDNGRYSISKVYELTVGGRGRSQTPKRVNKMRIEHDGTDYLLMSDQELSCLPQKGLCRNL